MNHCYRHVWNESTGQWVVASEIARSCGGPGRAKAVVIAAALAAEFIGASHALAAPPVNALPQSGQVAAGQATIATTPNRMLIDQRSDRAVINWQSFNIGANAAVNIQQPNATSALLNRITGNNASEIYGQLTANGRVYLSNPAGILFAPGSQVDVGALTATTRGIADADFIAGRDVFTIGKASGDITAQGSIRANEKVVLQGAAVNVSGVVQASGIVSQAGQIWLDGDSVMQEGTLAAAGGQVKVTSTGDVRFNGGRVSVANANGQGGRIEVTAPGEITAVASHSFDASGRSGGAVRIESGSEGRVLSSATIHADGSAGAGGSVELSGGSTLLLGATVTADGSTSGGSVHVGGGWQGSTALGEARSTFVGGSSKLSARGGGGAGGEVVAWSTGSTQFLGDAVASGAQGGRIEVSSKDSLGYAGTADAGHGGQVLFDPKNITVANAGASALSALTPTSFASTGANTSYTGFGTSVAIDGDRLAIGAALMTYSGQGNAGLVYLFNGVGSNFSGLTLQRTIGSTAPVAGGYFGSAVAISGDLLAIGAMGEGYKFNNTTSYSQGLVHLYSGVNTMTTSAPTLRRSIGDTTYSATRNPGSMPLMNDGGLVGFGSSVALSGDLLAIGANYAGGGSASAGQVYLFNGAGADFSGLTFRRLLGQSTNNQAASNPSGTPTMGSQMNFGTGVALDGDLLAIGVPGASSFDGLVYLYNGASSANFGGLSLKATLGSPGTGATLSPAGLTQNLGYAEYFGSAVSLNSGHLAVGMAYGNNYTTGGVFLFTNVGTDFSGLTLDRPAAVEPNGNSGGFGAAVALSGNLLAVGAPYGPDAVNFNGRVYYYNWTPGSGSADAVSSATFTTSPGANSNITPASITAILNTGSSVTLQANNDITVTDAVTASGGSHGDLTLRAGRNLTFNNNVTTNNGNLTAVAGDSGANATYRDAGTATLTIASGKTLNVGTGTATLAAVGGNVVNNAGNSAIATSGGGRWLVYAADPATTTEGFSTYNKHYNQAYAAGSTPSYAGSGNWFLYSIAPVLSVTPGSQTLTYGGTPGFTGSYSGFIDGDTSSTVAGTAAWSVGGSTSTAGKAIVGLHNVDYVSGLASSLGYSFQNNAASSNELTVSALQLTVGGSTAAATRAYNGSTAASISGGTVGGIVTNDVVNFSQSGSFANANAGIGKTVNYSNGIAGADAANYTLSSAGGTTTGTVNKADITVTSSNVTKTYDGTTSAIGTATLAAGTLYANASNGGTTDSLSGGTFAFTNRNAGTGNKTVTTSGVTVSDGNGGGNYNVSHADNTTSTINKATLTVRSSDVVKTYDSTLSAAGTAVAVSGLGTGDSVSGGTFAFTNANAGSGNKTVTTSGVTVSDGNGGNNYNTLVYQDNTTSTINRALLTVGTSNVTKTYDGSLAAAGTATVTAGTLFGTDSLSGGTFAFTNANAGTGKTVITAGVTVSDGNGGGNYNVGYASNTTSTISKANITVASANVVKTYDGTTTAAGSAVLSLGTLYANASNGGVQDSLSGGTFAFTNRNAGTGNKTVTTSGVTVSDGNSGGNYNLSYADNTTSTINKATLTVRSSDVVKTYDSTLSAAGTAVAVSGLGTGDSVSGGTFAFTNANAGSGNKTVTTSGVTINDGNGGNNYNALVYQANTSSTINRAALTIGSADVTKTYDGSLAATGTATVTAGTLFGTDSLSGGTFAFTNANAGTGKTVTAAGVTVSDGNGGGNYSVGYASNTTSTISKANITVASANVVKTYDGTTTAAGSATLAVGTLYANASNGGTTDSLSGGTFAFTNRNAGTGNKTVTTSGVTVSDGNGGGNYNVSHADNTTSTINKATLTVRSGDVVKTYDGSLAAAGMAVVVSGLGTGDSVSGGTFAFTNANAGSGNKTVTTSGVTVNDGNGGSNYNALVYQANTTSSINRAALTIATSDVTKTYDGSLVAAGAAVVSSGTLFANASNGGATDSLGGGTFAFTNANAGAGNKTVTTSGVTVSDGNGGGNYTVGYASNTTSTINKANITVSSANVTKTYDGTTNAAGTATLSVGTLYANASNGGATDSLSGGTFAFANRNAGVGNKTVTTSGVTVSDGNGGGNYNVSHADNTTSTINKATLTVRSSDVVKTYDSTLSAAGTAVAVSGLGTGDSVSGGTFAFTNANAGSGNKTVTTSGVTVSDGNGGNNYNTLVYQDNTTSTINRALLTVGTSNVTKTYDGSLAAAGTATVTGGTLFGSDSLSGGTFAFTNANAGTGKTVITAGVTVNDGNGGGNYNVGYAGNTSSTINKADITVSSANVSKTYDGTTSAGGAAVLSAGTLYANASNGGALDTLSGGTFAFTNRNAGTGNKTVTVSGVTATGGNYNVSYADNTTSTINKATLTVKSSDVVKTYDGSLAASGTATAVSGLMTGDSLSGGMFAFTNANAGAGKTVTTSGVTVNDGNSGNNYNAVVYQANTGSAINRVALTLGTVDVVKTYDGSLAAAGTATVTAGTLFANASNGGALDGLSGGTFAFTNANAGAGNKTVTTSGVTVNDGNGGGNYTVGYASNTTSTISKANITVASSNVTKTYDGTTAAAGTATLAAGTLYANASNGGATDSLSGGTFAFTNRNAGSGNKTVTTSGVTVSDGNGGGNYNVAYADNTTSTINKATLTVKSSDVVKTYDGSLAASGTATAVSGLMTGDSLSGGMFAFTNANAGAGKTVTTSGVTVNDGNSGNNYNALVYQANTSSTINRAPLTIGTSNVTKTYDGTLAAAGTATVNAGTLYTNASSGGATDSLSGGTFAFTNANAGSGNKVVTTSGVTVNDGNNGGNYSVSYAVNTASTINKADITVSSANVAKTYDGTTSAAGTATLSAGTLYTNASNGGTTDSLGGGTFAFTNRNAGSGNKTVTTSGVTVSDGNGGGNYNLSYADNTTSTIHKATLTITPTAQSRTYDGTAASSAIATVSGVQAGDSVGGVVQAFDSRNAGARTLGITAYTLVDGNGGNNYDVVANGTVAGTIARANLTVTTRDVTKTYDGTLSAAGTAVAASGLVAGDTVSGGSFAFADKNAGAGNKTVNVAGVTVNDGNGGGNYSVGYASNTTSTITPAQLAVAAVGVNKVYDATTAGTAALSDNRVAGDSLTLAYGAATFLDKQVGDGKTLTVSGIALSGADAANYRANTTATTSANVTPAAITSVGGITAANKVFDGKAGATLELAGAVFNGKYAGDVLGLGGASGLFSDATVGNAKTVRITGLTLIGADAGNYTLLDATALTLASISALPVDLGYVAYHAPLPDNLGGTIASANGTPTFGSNLGNTGKASVEANRGRPNGQPTNDAGARSSRLNSWVDVVDGGVLMPR